MARALVIGGTLFIGRALVDQLLERGDDVTPQVSVRERAGEEDERRTVPGQPV